MIGRLTEFGSTLFTCGCVFKYTPTTKLSHWSMCSMHANAHELFVVFMEARVEMPGDTDRRIDWLRRATALAFRILERLPKKGVKSA